MKLLTKILIVTVVVTSSIEVLFYRLASYAQVGTNRPVRASVLLREPADPYNALLKENLENIQNQEKGKIEFNFYDSKNNQAEQDKLLNNILEEGNTDLVLINVIEPKETKSIIDKIKMKNIPVVFFNIEEPNMDALRSYNKAYFVGTNSEEAGILQGEILVRLWNQNKATIDKNHDNIMQYVMLMGNKDNLEAIGRTRYSVSTINDAGIQTQELALKVCNWDKNQAIVAMEQAFLQNGDKIEAVISNNDAMAIGAIEVLQKYGYNKGDANKTIPVVGVDAIPEARELIRKGEMAGTVIQDAYKMAKAVYDIGMNLVHNRPPLEGTEYKFDSTGVSVRIPYREYIENNS
ncbi:galactose ABC transporter substrate-binding protein [Clostridium sp. BL-8]|uniref:galactose ABC transporter substrate-binding protein n=1 Tax=Clostridium sp. BL-8 TaxID=349938 RepID=UPI00098BE0E0|nr:galactose ABC transporter substrate-binding protein [Clostridium sp. BL-8]OOM74931.1 D-galactose-binding periplasmic protein precursor [Clostridium sp. BL-8]